MSQFFILPYWICESRDRPDRDQRDLQTTELHVTNPGGSDARLEVVTYEARGDGSFERAEWGSGRWAAPARWQRVLRFYPSRAWGGSFYTYGWAEVWLSSDRMTAEAAIGVSARPLSLHEPELRATRHVPLIAQRAPFFNAFIETITRVPYSPLEFPPGTQTIPADRLPVQP